MKNQVQEIAFLPSYALTGELSFGGKKEKKTKKKCCKKYKKQGKTNCKSCPKLCIN